MITIMCLLCAKAPNIIIIIIIIIIIVTLYMPMTVICHIV